MIIMIIIGIIYAVYMKHHPTCLSDDKLMVFFPLAESPCQGLFERWKTNLPPTCRCWPHGATSKFEQCPYILLYGGHLITSHRILLPGFIAIPAIIQKLLKGLAEACPSVSCQTWDKLDPPGNLSLIRCGLGISESWRCLRTIKPVTTKIRGLAMAQRLCKMSRTQTPRSLIGTAETETLHMLCEPEAWTMLYTMLGCPQLLSWPWVSPTSRNKPLLPRPWCERCLIGTSSSKALPL